MSWLRLTSNSSIVIILLPSFLNCERRQRRREPGGLVVVLQDDYELLFLKEASFRSRCGAKLKKTEVQL
jgi:hypothetical protein